MGASVDTLILFFPLYVQLFNCLVKTKENEALSK